MRSRATSKAYRDALREEAIELIDRVAAEIGGDVPVEVVADTSPPHALHALCEETGAALVGSAPRIVVARPRAAREHRRAAPARLAVPGRDRAARLRQRRASDPHDRGRLRRLRRVRARARSAVELARRVGAELRVMRVFDSTQVGTPALMTGAHYVPVSKEIEAAEGRPRAARRRAAGRRAGAGRVRRRRPRPRAGRLLARGRRAAGRVARLRPGARRPARRHLARAGPRRGLPGHRAAARQLPAVRDERQHALPQQRCRPSS